MRDTTDATGASGPTLSSLRVDGKFRNAVPLAGQTLRDRIAIFMKLMRGKPAGTRPTGEIPVTPLTRAQLLAAPDATLFRLGHSTMLMKFDGAFFLTDPVFSERASPVQWAGPARFHRAPICIADLPPIKAVILSHDHYDHLDHASVMALADKAEHFIAPLGVGQRLIDWGIAAAKVRELDWWQSTGVDRVTLVATPARHFSGRTLRDGDATLWASFVIRHPDVNLFFSGDSGYFPGFQEIGQRYGPFDVAMVETGAYDPLWPDVHMQPEETVQAFSDLRGEWLMPVHNGTFDLGLHPWREPFDRIAGLAQERQLKMTTPQMGEALNLRAPHRGQAWWTTVD